MCEREKKDAEARMGLGLTWVGWLFSVYHDILILSGMRWDQGHHGYALVAVNFMDFNNIISAF